MPFLSRTPLRIGSRVFLSGVLSLCTLPLHAQGGAAGMAAATSAILASQPAATAAHWGISVVDATTGATVWSRDDNQLFAPASNAKLFTTATALALLGPGFTMKTEIIAEGPIDASGNLHGALRLVGGGDPTISGRSYPYTGHTERSDTPLAPLNALAGQVAAAGIHAVDGPVLADDTLFPDERYGTAWNWDDLQWEYGAPVSALTVNDNVRYLSVTPGAGPGAPLTAAWDTAVLNTPDNLQVTAQTSAHGTEPALGISRDFSAGPNGALLRIYGSLPQGGAASHLAIALEDPARFAGQALAAALAADGVALHGSSAPVHRPSSDTEGFTRETHEPVPLSMLAPGTNSLSLRGAYTPPPGSRIVATRLSVPLNEIVTVTNKVSQNLHAELMLRLVGRADGADGSAAQGARVVRALMTTQAGIAPDEFLLHDGSGLSSQDLVTPRAITTLLHWSTTQPWGGIYRESLPIAGVDGSLSSRLANLRGRVQAKTGTLNEVDALSGFITTSTGRTLAFSILCNAYPGTGSRAVLDALVTAIERNF